MFSSILLLSLIGVSFLSLLSWLIGHVGTHVHIGDRAVREVLNAAQSGQKVKLENNSRRSKTLQ